MKIRLALLAAVVLLVGGWGPRGHITANKAAVDAIPDDGPVFLRNYREWIAQTGPLPDSWRGASEPYSKIFEDPNHGWFKEQFAFLKVIPRSRYEFVLALYDEFLKIQKTDPERAKLTNVRWTGTMPYAAMENYDRMKAAMRAYRQASAAKQDTKFIEQDIAFYMGWTGHYTADGAQPLHDTIHHDGWVGANPKGYATDPRVHGRFESQFVELIQLTEGDLAPQVTKARVLDDPWAAMIGHLDDASSHVEEVYELDKSGALADAKNAAAAGLVKVQLGKAASLLRDLVYTAWVESGKPVGRMENPVDSKSVGYNPATGSAPPIH
jgi:hypothetical protein